MRRFSEWYRSLSIEHKAHLITTAVLCVLACALITGSFEVLRRSFSRLETASVHEAVTRIQAALQLNLDQLARGVRDYSSWNETYDFVRTRNAQYVESNFAPTSLTNLKLDAFLIFDAAGELIVGREAKGDSSFVEPGKWWKDLAQTARDTATGEGKTIKGLFIKEGRLAYLASQPILREDNSGPPRGAIVQMKLYDEDAMRELQMLTSIPVTLHLTPSPETPGNRSTPFSTGPDFTWEPADSERIALNIRLNDLAERPVARLMGSLERNVFQEGLRALTLQIVGIGLVTLTAAALIMKLLRVLVLRRLAALDSGVRRISETEHLDLETRLEVHGGDEIARLTQQINRLLEALASAERRRKNDERERELLNAQLQQAQKMEAVGTMAGGIAHDFNNLLCSILGSAELLRHEVALNEEGAALVRRIEKAGGNAAGLIRQLLTFSRRQNSVQKPVKLGDVVQDLLNLARTCIPDTIELRCVRLTQDDWTLGDPTQLQQVVMNLATNAAHAMAGRAEGRFLVQIDNATLPDSGRPETTTLPRGRYVRIRFSDTGSGIPQEILPRIFEPFFTTKPVGSGSGLGLSVVHGIILRHHGSIGVESVLGSGTTFIVHLPCKDAPDQAGLATDRVHGALGADREAAAAKGILLVDDDSMVRDVLATGLRKRGHSVLAANGGDEALRILKDPRTRIDALITDQMMPGLTGVELGCHAQNLRPGLQMLLISGYADVIDTEALREKGFSGLFSKPVSIDQIETFIRTG